MRESTKFKTFRSPLMAAFIKALVKEAGVSENYADAAWFTLSRDGIKTVEDAQAEARKYADMLKIKRARSAPL